MATHRGFWTAKEHVYTEVSPEYANWTLNKQKAFVPIKEIIAFLEETIEKNSRNSLDTSEHLATLQTTQELPTRR